MFPWKIRWRNSRGRKSRAVSIGSVSEVVREGLLLLQRREDLWKKEMQAKIEEGIADCRGGPHRAGRTGMGGIRRLA